MPGRSETHVDSTRAETRAHSAVYPKLESALYGSLLHIGHVAALAVGASLAIVRVFGDRDQTAHAAVVGGLHLTPEELATLEAWAMAEDSLFADLAEDYQKHPPLRRLRPLRRKHALPAGCLEQTHEIWYLHVPVTDSLWAAVVVFHDVPLDAQASSRHQHLLKLRPEMARQLCLGWQHDCRTQGMPTDATAGGGDRKDLSACIAKLSRTERRILHHLCEELTEREISEHIGRSHHTIHAHTKSIYRKLSINSRKQLMELIEGHALPPT